MRGFGSPSVASSPVQRVAFIAAAWAALYLPVYAYFAMTAWQREGNFHHPFVLAMFLAIFFSKLAKAIPPVRLDIKQQAGLALSLMLGAAAYVFGRLNEIDVILSASQFLFFAAVMIAFVEKEYYRSFLFPLACLCLLIVWPGWAIDIATAPLKQFISSVVANGLYGFGLPITHEGAVISLGQYELLVADACAGLNSFLSLLSVGVFYLYFAQRKNGKAIFAVVIAMAPIAVIANILRVALLALITFYWGYDAGQGFLHEAAGLVMYATALCLVFCIDAIAARRWERAP